MFFFFVIDTVVLDHFDVGFGRGGLALVVRDGEMEVILAQRSFGGDVDVLVELGVLDADVLAGRVTFLDLVGAAFLVDFHADAFDEAFGQDVGFQMDVVALLGLSAVFMADFGQRNLRGGRILLAGGEAGDKCDNGFMLNVR